MKEVYFSRHAKSSWEHFSLKDFDRPLNARGKSDAPLMAEKLFQKIDGKLIDAILSSPSERTIQTLLPFAKQFGIYKDMIFHDKNLYHAEAEMLVESLWQLNDTINSVLVFAHNPGMSVLINQISEDHISNVSTCGLFKVVFQANNWSEIDVNKANLEFYIYPKMYV